MRLAYRPYRLGVADVRRLPQQAGFIRIAQVRQQAGAQVDALAYVQRQGALCRMEDIDAGLGRHVRQGCTQVLGVFVDARLIQLRPSAGGYVHGFIPGAGA